MNNLIQNDEKIKSTYIYIGYLVLKKLKKQKSDKLSIFEIIDYLKKELKMIHYRQLMFSLTFLYSLDLIDFKAPYIFKK